MTTAAPTLLLDRDRAEMLRDHAENYPVRDTARIRWHLTLLELLPDVPSGDAAHDAVFAGGDARLRRYIESVSGPGGGAVAVTVAGLSLVDRLRLEADLIKQLHQAGPAARRTLDKMIDTDPTGELLQAVGVLAGYR